jgi:hypothetical protein
MSDRELCKNCLIKPTATVDFICFPVDLKTHEIIIDDGVYTIKKKRDCG